MNLQKVIKYNERGFPEVWHNTFLDGLWYDVYYKTDIIFNKYYKKDELICYRFKEEKPRYLSIGGRWIDYCFNEKRFKAEVMTSDSNGLLKTIYVGLDKYKFEKNYDSQIDWLLKELTKQGYKNDADFIEKEMHKEVINRFTNRS